MKIEDHWPPGWREVADCVDRYEVARALGVPSLRELAARVPPEYRTVALAELAAVDMEFCWDDNTPKRVEEYLDEYPEIRQDAKSAETLIAQEYRVRHRHNENPALDEYRRRFPDYDVEHGIVGNDTCTFNLGEQTPQDGDRNAGPPPEVIGRYRVKGEIGSGAFGRVYRCDDDLLKREVAVKLAHATAMAAGLEQVKGFIYEARSAARLRHPAIVSVLDTGRIEDGRVFIVFEYIPGQTLRDGIEHRAYSRQQAVGWCVEIAEALHYAHTHRIVHRDLSPANVLLDEQKHARLTDFGLSKMDDQFFQDDSGRVLGSLAYISPEQARGEAQWASAQSDIYSLGVILYELLVGHRPFDAGRSRGLPDVLAQIERRVPDPPRSIDDTIPKALEAVCLKAMAKNPANRYTTASDMAAELRAAMTPCQTSWLRRRLPMLGGAVAAGVLVAAIGGPYGRVPQPTAPPPGPTDGEEVGKSSSGGQIVNLPTRDIDEPDFKMRLLQPQGLVDLGDEESRWLLPLRDGDYIEFNARLAEAGFIYVLGYFGGRGMELVWPPGEQLSRHEKTATLDHPEVGGERAVMELTSEQEYGTEMFLLAVADNPLTQEDLDTFRNVPFDPPDKIRQRARDHLLKYPVPEAEIERGIQWTSLSEVYVGKALSDQLEHFHTTGKLRSYRALIYWHAKGKPGSWNRDHEGT